MNRNGPNFWRASLAVALILPLWLALIGERGALVRAQNISSGNILGAPGDIPTDTDDESDGVSSEERQGNENARNVVQIRNRVDDRLRVKGNVQLNQIRGSTVTPSNIAFALGSCTDCQTFAIALQIDLYGPDATTIAPGNAAVAVNSGCTHCYTVARALQYVLQVDDANLVPSRVNSLVHEMDQQLQSIHDRSVTVAEAEQQIDAVIQDFVDLADRLDDRRDERTDDVRTAGPTATPTGTSPVVTETPGAVATPTLEPTTPAAPTETPIAPTPTSDAVPPTPTSIATTQLVSTPDASQGVPLTPTPPAPTSTSPGPPTQTGGGPPTPTISTNASTGTPIP